MNIWWRLLFERVHVALLIAERDIYLHSVAVEVSLPAELIDHNAHRCGDL